MLIVHPSSHCDICAHSFTEERPPYTIPCGHIFCQSCFHDVEDKNCPLCRRSYDPLKIKKLHVGFGEGLSSSPQKDHSALILLRRLSSALALGDTSAAQHVKLAAVLEEIDSWLDLSADGDSELGKQSLSQVRALIKEYAFTYSEYYRVQGELDRFRHETLRSLKSVAEDCNYLRKRCVELTHDLDVAEARSTALPSVAAGPQTRKVKSSDDLNSNTTTYIPQLVRLDSVEEAVQQGSDFEELWPPVPFFSSASSQRSRSSSIDIGVSEEPLRNWNVIANYNRLAPTGAASQRFNVAQRGSRSPTLYNPTLKAARRHLATFADLPSENVSPSASRAPSLHNSSSLPQFMPSWKASWRLSEPEADYPSSDESVFEGHNPRSSSSVLGIELPLPALPAPPPAPRLPNLPLSPTNSNRLARPGGVHFRPAADIPLAPVRSRTGSVVSNSSDNSWGTQSSTFAHISHLRQLNSTDRSRTRRLRKRASRTHLLMSMDSDPAFGEFGKMLARKLGKKMSRSLVDENERGGGGSKYVDEPPRRRPLPLASVTSGN